MIRNPRIVLAGSVNSSRAIMEKLIQHEMNLVGVLGLALEKQKDVSGFCDLGVICRGNSVPFRDFLNLNSPEIVEHIRLLQPDLLFVVGLSQLVASELLQVPTHGVIGYHPTRLPEGRGRGTIAWLVLGKAPAAVTFFQIDEGMDSGPIWFQVPFEVEESDYAQDVIDKVVRAICAGLDKALPGLKLGKLDCEPQDHSKATYLGVRRPQDGLINWSASAIEIARLVRAVSKPLPGAYTYLKNKKMIVQRATVSTIRNHFGVPGRLLLADASDGYIIQTGDGLLRLEEVEGIEFQHLRPGVKLGLDFETELMALRNAQERKSKCKD